VPVCSQTWFARAAPDAPEAAAVLFTSSFQARSRSARCSRHRGRRTGAASVMVCGAVCALLMSWPSACSGAGPVGALA